MAVRQQKLPNEYRELDDKELIRRITRVKQQYHEKLVLLAHHYQRQEIVDLADFVGDSYELARRAVEQEKAEYIVFCGVRFMAESAAILARSGQIVIHPDVDAGCPLADMADIDKVELVWNQLTEVVNVNDIMPIVYINSDAELKAFCGRHGGTVCTSSNALNAMKWGFNKRSRIFFFPDANLGQNTAEQLQVPASQVVRWDPEIPMGGNTKPQIEQSRIILWNGHCHVHTWFQTEHIRKIRKKYPQVKIVVHPECNSEVVNQADASGSTKFIVNYVDAAAPGSTIAVGTEINLVDRLAKKYSNKTILPLSKSPCPNMWKISLNDLAWVMENLGRENVVKVDEQVIQFSRYALKNMLEIGK